MGELVSVKEAAVLLGDISKYTVEAWLSQGKIQRTKVGGRTMIRRSELERVINDGGKSPAPKRSSAPAESDLPNQVTTTVTLPPELPVQSISGEDAPSRIGESDDRP